MALATQGPLGCAVRPRRMPGGFLGICACCIGGCPCERGVLSMYRAGIRGGFTRLGVMSDGAAYLGKGSGASGVQASAAGSKQANMLEGAAFQDIAASPVTGLARFPAVTQILPSWTTLDQ